jgi:hypothetical protein
MLRSPTCQLLLKYLIIIRRPRVASTKPTLNRWLLSIANSAPDHMKFTNSSTANGTRSPGSVSPLTNLLANSLTHLKSCAPQESDREVCDKNLTRH